VQVELLAQRILDLDLQTIALSENLITYRWLLEELRVSVFAQELRAKGFESGYQSLEGKETKGSRRCLGQYSKLRNVHEITSTTI
jgi:hypothetical protein